MAGAAVGSFTAGLALSLVGKIASRMRALQVSWNNLQNARAIEKLTMKAISTIETLEEIVWARNRKTEGHIRWKMEWQYAILKRQHEQLRESKHDIQSLADLAHRPLELSFLERSFSRNEHLVSNHIYFKREYSEIRYTMRACDSYFYKEFRRAIPHPIQRLRFVNKWLNGLEVIRL